MPETRGSWSVDRAIALRLQSAGLEAAFRALWSNPAANKLAINDGDARPDTPYPYCCYNVVTPERVITRQTGKTEDTEIHTLSATIQFDVHSDTKDKAKDACKMLASALDKAALDMEDDQHVTTIRQTDFYVRLGDRQWKWVIQYEIRYEATYSSSLT